jgi:adenylate cyclase
MICFNCGMRIYKGDNKECRICGVKFANKCQVCGSPNPAMANFCMNCSARLTKTDSQRLLRDIDLLHESRRNVAVIFADISGFTALSEKLDPEDVREIVNDCFNYITKPVYEMGGTIDKYIGDCVMILFGAKYSHSDDVKRAVICAMKMMKLIREFSDNNISLRGFSLSLSIGINYGLVVTGEVGNYYDKDYTVMGDIVNTAQRLQSNAGEGVILVSESVFSETSDMVEYSSMK